MTTDPLLPVPSNPYPVTVTADIDGNNDPYFIYHGPDGQRMHSPLRIPAADPPFDSIRFTQVGDKKRLRFWAAATHTLNGSSPVPQGDNLLLTEGESVAIAVGCGTWRGTILIFELRNHHGTVVQLVATPDPMTQNDG
jgi:hypothetical protein